MNIFDTVDTQTTELWANNIQLQAKSSNSLEKLSHLSNSVNQQSTSSNINESRSKPDTQVDTSRGSPGIQFVFCTSSSRQNTSCIDKRSAKISDIISQECSYQLDEEIELTTIETSAAVAHDTGSEPQVPTIEGMILAIVSPIGTLTNLSSNCYMSSDAYYGHLGAHRPVYHGK